MIRGSSAKENAAIYLVMAYKEPMSMFGRQDYPLKEPLPKIERHDQLPPDAEVLGSCLNTYCSPGFERLYTFVKRGIHLSILVSRTLPAKTGPDYLCTQYDFPLKVLSWFPMALGEFIKPPAEGGLPAGAIIGKDQDVDGEMLAVGNTQDGYDLTNRSRQDPSFRTYSPMWLPLDWDFLYRGGMLELWKELGEKYERGAL